MSRDSLYYDERMWHFVLVYDFYGMYMVYCLLYNTWVNTCVLELDCIFDENSTACLHLPQKCFANFLKTFEDWTTSNDRGYGVNVTFLDFKKNV